MEVSVDRIHTRDTDIQITEFESAYLTVAPAVFVQNW